MGLRDAGKIQISKSGKALEIIYETAIDRRFYVPLEAAKAVVEGNQTSAKMSMLVHENRVGEKFDL